MCRYYSETFASEKDFEGRISKWNLVPGYKRPRVEHKNFLEQSHEVGFEEVTRSRFSVSPMAVSGEFGFQSPVRFRDKLGK